MEVEEEERVGSGRRSGFLGQQGEVWERWLSYLRIPFPYDIVKFLWLGSCPCFVMDVHTKEQIPVDPANFLATINC